MHQKQLVLALKGIGTHVPGMYRMFAKQKAIGTYSAEVCYKLWFKHLTMLWEHGIPGIPETVAELGPGSSVGVGLAALLSGVKNYYALDVEKHVEKQHSIEVFDELVGFFKNRMGVEKKGWPPYYDHLDSNQFPGHILTEKVLNESLAPERLASIRNDLLNMDLENQKGAIRYVAPWSDPNVIIKESVDVIFSHAVLEHVTNLEDTYKAFLSWLKPKGWMSHQIDFKSHGLATEWNGHWAYSELMWKMIMGKRPYLINRQPCSIHTALVKENGFDMILHLKSQRPSGIERSQLSSSWQHISDDDLTCSNTFFLARRS